MESTSNIPNILDSSLNCCLKCKGLFKVSADENNKHLLSCSGNPFKSPTSYFACERNIFLQLFQPEDFQLDGSFNLQNISKDDSFLNQVVKIRLQQEMFDPLLFLRNYTATGPTALPVSSLDLLDENITDLDTVVNKDVPFVDDEKSAYAVTGDEDQIENIINTNIDYLKRDTIAQLHSSSGKQTFTQSTSEPSLLSPIEKQLDFLTDGSKLQSPFVKGTSFLPECNDEYQNDSLNFATTKPVPFSCTLSTDLLGDLSVSQTVNQSSLTSINEPCPTLQHLDIAKKDPFLGENQDLEQLNSKDPFLINATVVSDKQVGTGQRWPSSAKSFVDMHTSPTFQLQDGNYFNFPSMLDEPTQLDYLDLATIDFLTNPNFNYGLKDKTLNEKSDFSSDFHTPGQEVSMPALTFDSFDRFDKNMTLPTRTMDDSAVDRKMKRLRMKKVKTRLPKKTKNMYTDKDNMNPKSTDSSPRTRRNSAKDTDRAILKVTQSRQHIIGQSSEAPEKATDRSKSTSRKRKFSLPSNLDIKSVDDPAKVKGEVKLNIKSRLCQSDEIFNVKDRLAGFSEEEKESYKAVIGKNTCVLVKKQKLMPYYKPPIIAKVNELMTLNQSSPGRLNLNSSILSMNENEPGTFLNSNTDCGSVGELVIKCPRCSCNCNSIKDLKRHQCHLYRSPSRKQIVFTCFECKFTSDSITGLADHVRSHATILPSHKDQDYQLDTALQNENYSVKASTDIVEEEHEHVTESIFETKDNVVNCLSDKELVNTAEITVLNETTPPELIEFYATEDTIQWNTVKNGNNGTLMLQKALIENSDDALTELHENAFQQNDNLELEFTSNVESVECSSYSHEALYNEHNITTKAGKAIHTGTQKIHENASDTVDAMKLSGHVNTLDGSTITNLKELDKLSDYTGNDHVIECHKIFETDTCLDAANERSTSYTVKLNDQHSDKEKATELDNATEVNQKVFSDSQVERGAGVCDKNKRYKEISIDTEVEENINLMTECDVKYPLSIDLETDRPRVRSTQIVESKEITVGPEHIMPSSQTQNDKGTLTYTEICDPYKVECNRSEIYSPRKNKHFVDETSYDDRDEDSDIEESYIDDTQNKELYNTISDVESNFAGSLNREHAYSKPSYSSYVKQDDQDDNKVDDIHSKKQDTHQHDHKDRNKKHDDGQNDQKDRIIKKQDDRQHGLKDEKVKNANDQKNDKNVRTRKKRNVQEDRKAKKNTVSKDNGNKSNTTFKCDHCSFESQKKTIISRHNEKFHGEYWYCSVPDCEFKTVYKRNLTLHTMKHEGVKRFLCDKCPYSTPDATCLTSHRKHNHESKLRFKCTDCDFTSIMRMEILRHYRNRHLQQKIYACNQCDYRTGYTYLLKFHLMSHAGIKPFKCSLCDYQVCNGTKVARHIKTVHVGQVDAKCIKLDLTFEIDAKQFKCAEPVNEKDIKVIELTEDQVKLFEEKKRREIEMKKEASERKEREKMKKSNNRKVPRTKSVKLVSILGNVEGLKVQEH